MTGTVITDLGNGIETVPADDRRLAEREALRVRLHHVANMWRLPLHGRQEYLASVSRREGSLARDRLAEAFSAAWAARKKAAK